MCSQIFFHIIVCHAIILDAATIVTVARVRTVVIAFPMSVASSEENALGLVAISETAVD